MTIHNRIRTLIAQEAARIIIEEGIDDLLVAKQKAARHLDIETDRQMPTNEEIEQAAAEFQRLFGDSRQACRLNKLREIALESMEFMASFSPRLTGTVAEGAAGKFTPITIFLFAETAEEILLKLLDARIPFRQTSHEFRESKKVKSLYPAFSLLIDDITVELKFLPYTYLHQLSKKTKNRCLSIAALRNAIETSRTASNIPQTEGSEPA